MNINKKVVASTAAVLGIAAIVVGGTIAYFTDKDTATNTFTVGNVDITLNEKDFNGVDIDPDNVGQLMPGWADTAGVAKNATVTVKDGSSDSYVWVELLIPAPLYQSKTETNENNNALHVNQFLDYLTKYNGTLSGNDNAKQMRTQGGYTPDWQWSILKYIDQVTVHDEQTGDDIEYARLRTTHKDVVVARQTTSPAFSQFYMDNDVYYDHTNQTYMIPADGKATTTTSWVPYTGDWKVIVNAYAIQAAGLTKDQNHDGVVDVNDAVLYYTDRN
ncbi:SipW-dependent-type signal peptide-containing protein [Candidatus Saccharibacteria bacterium]|nr:SipW-dependent-type signal peptide-containing protein [Candidatus Saccharibacteria bacterium]